MGHDYKKKGLNCRNPGPSPKKSALKLKPMLKCDRNFSPKTIRKFAKFFFENREFVTKYYFFFVFVRTNFCENSSPKKKQNISALRLSRVFFAILWYKKKLMKTSVINLKVSWLYTLRKTHKFQTFWWQEDRQILLKKNKKSLLLDPQCWGKGFRVLKKILNPYSPTNNLQKLLECKLKTKHLISKNFPNFSVAGENDEISWRKNKIKITAAQWLAG